MKPPPLSSVLAIAACAIGLAVPTATGATLEKLVPAQAWHLVEFRLEQVPAVANPFDPDQIRIDATFTAPSGAKAVVPAFWYQAFERKLVDGAEAVSPSAPPEWRLRFTPSETGRYHVEVAISSARGPAAPSAALDFDVAASAPAPRTGWVRVAPDLRYLETSDGQPLRLIGQNVCWPEAGGTFDYDRWFAAMRDSGQNFARLWLAPWSFGLEHGVGTLNHYRLDEAWKLDRVFEEAGRDGIYLMLSFDHHGMFQVDSKGWAGTNNFWKVNPYSRLAGGPCAQPNDFFTDPVARETYTKRLRYLIARYGWSPALLSWQFFNEIDNVYGPLHPADVLAWHREMGDWLKAHDPYHHLVTTSLTGGSVRDDIWSLPEMDLAVYHSYMDPAPGRKVAMLAREFHDRFHKPMLVGECGTDYREWNLAADPYLRGFRQLLWGGALGGSLGTSMSWWWQDIHADRADSLYAALARILAEGGWDRGVWEPAAADASGPQPAGLGEVLPGEAPFSTPVALNSFRRFQLDGHAFIASPLAAQRASEHLQNFIPAEKVPGKPGAQRITASFASDAKMTLGVKSADGAAVLVVRIDGAETLRESLGDAASERPVEINRTFTIALPEGRHTVEIDNAGGRGLLLGSIALQRVRPAAYPGGWRFEPETVGLRSGDRALLYVVSPHTVYPAGALRYRPATVSGATIALEKWKDGEYRVRWYDPATARLLGETTARASGGRLVVPAPDFNDDLAAIVGG